MKSNKSKIYIAIAFIILSLGQSLVLLRHYQAIKVVHPSQQYYLSAASNYAFYEPVELDIAYNQENYQSIIDNIESIKVDQEKVSRVRSYLASIRSPLAEKAEFLVKTADEVGLDYRLVPAISVIESTGGRFCYKPYNAWGWGGANHGFTFNSWEEAILTVSKGLKKGYYDKGLVTANDIAPKYNPDTPNEWKVKVQMVMDQM